MLEPITLSADSAELSTEMAEGPRIVIAEDDPTVRLVLAGVLTSEGYQVAEAADGNEALARARDTRPDLIILDVEMPGMNGFEVCRAIRGSSGQDGPPVLILTGLGQKTAVTLAFEAGATDFASKPITPELLRHRVRFLLRNASALTQLRCSEQALEQAQRIARLGSWSWHLPSGLTSYSRPAFDLLGLSPDGGLWIREYLDRIPSAEQRVVEAAVLAARRDGLPMDLQHRIQLPGGAMRDVHCRAELERDAAGRPVYLHGTIQDVTERVEAEARIRQLALFDQLTGLPNRGQFTDHLRLGLINAERRVQSVAVLHLDVNNFKRINDARSHETGDAVLSAISTRLRGLLRATDGLARHGGPSELMLARQGSDEFLVSLGDLELGEHAAVVANRLLEAFRKPFRACEEEFMLSACIGISVYPDDGGTPEELLKNAASALAEAKRLGGNSFEFFDRVLGQRVAARRTLEEQVRKAVEREEFTLYYQPQVDAGGRIVGAEALMRWFLPDGTLVPPSTVIPVIEETGLIHKLVDWTMRSGLAQLSAWDRAGLVLPKLAVNLSARQLGSPGLVDHLAGMVREAGISPERIVLEILESALIEQADAKSVLEEFRNQGFRIALDDFGTGYSALSYLPRFPIDILKIDRSFVRDLPNNAGQAAIVRAIISLATELGIESLGEGVELEVQREFLERAGCRLFQGYLFGKAIPPEDLAHMLAK
jgi:diguanylate cyclase (GGDEF)-like protein